MDVGEVDEGRALAVEASASLDILQMWLSEPEFEAT